MPSSRASMRQTRLAANAGTMRGVYTAPFPIETDRLVLRAYRPDDFDALYAIVSRTDLNRFLYTEPRDEDETVELLQGKVGNTELVDEDDHISPPSACARPASSSATRCCGG
jgi:RimJ/RimL family protein N-acetyltransferase